MLQRLHWPIVPNPECLGSIESLLECCGIPRVSHAPAQTLQCAWTVHRHFSLSSPRVFSLHQQPIVFYERCSMFEFPLYVIIMVLPKGLPEIVKIRYCCTIRDHAQSYSISTQCCFKMEQERVDFLPQQCCGLVYKIRNTVLSKTFPYDDLYFKLRRRHAQNI